MTFDFTPDWMDSLLRSSGFSHMGPGTSPLWPQPAPPSHPDAREMAALVGELFAEGTLSAEQFHSLISDPTLEPYRHPTLQPRDETP